MSEGTKFGASEQDLDTALNVDKESLLDDLTATKVGDVSEFEKSLYEEGALEESTQEGTEGSVEEGGAVSQEKSSSENLLFEEAMDQPFVGYKEGDLVKGIVRSVEKGGVFVDINFKSDGFISNAEFTADPTVVVSSVIKAGDEVEACIEKLESKEGYTILSRKKAEYERSWNQLVSAIKSKETLSVYVVSKVQGGLVVSFLGIKGFVPASQVAKDNDMDAMVGQSIDVMVLQADRRRRKVIFSNKLLQMQGRDEAFQKMLESIEIGSVCHGKVTSVKGFGVFVDLGGIEGLVHISELSWSRVNDPADFVSVGDEVDVFVLGIDRDSRRVSLGMKQLQPDPWVDVAEKYAVGQVVTGKITRVVAFGAFMQLNKQLEGLIHISEVSEQRVSNIEDFLSVGDEVKAVIVKLVMEEQKIGLSLKNANRAEGGQEDGVQTGASQAEEASQEAVAAETPNDEEGQEAVSDAVVSEDTATAEASISERVAATEEAVSDEKIEQDPVDVVEVEEKVETVEE